VGVGESVFTVVVELQVGGHIASETLGQVNGEHLHEGAWQVQLITQNSCLLQVDRHEGHSLLHVHDHVVLVDVHWRLFF
jgi:hypothetical protein